MDFGKEIVNPSGGKAVDWDRSYFVVQILLDSFDHMAGIVVDNMALAVGRNSTQSFVVVSDKGMADYDRLIDDSSENQSEPRAPFARCIHHSSSNLVVYYQTWANISSAIFSITHYEVMSGKVIRFVTDNNVKNERILSEV